MRELRIAVAGAHLSGMPLNHQLIDRDATLELSTTTAACYRLFELDLTPPRPGLVRVADGGKAIELEVWRLPAANFAEFIDTLDSPMAIGHIELIDGTWVNGFVCEPYALNQARDISKYGGWRATVAHARPSADDAPIPP